MGFSILPCSLPWFAVLNRNEDTKSNATYWNFSQLNICAWKEFLCNFFGWEKNSYQV